MEKKFSIHEVAELLGISLYRKLNVGIAEIKILQKRLGKLKVMKKHMTEIQQGVGKYTLKELPRCYAKQINTTGVWEYEKLKEIISTELFSFGNIGYHVRHDSDGTDNIESFEFFIREPMLELCMEQIQKEHMISRPECNCIYTVYEVKEYGEVQWEFKELFSYAEKHGYQCTGELFAFYVYSLICDEQKVDYYEIYIPLL